MSGIEARGRHARRRRDPAQMVEAGWIATSSLSSAGRAAIAVEPIAALGDRAPDGDESLGALGMSLRRTVLGEARILDDRDAAGGAHRGAWYLTGACVAGSRDAGKERS